MSAPQRLKRDEPAWRSAIVERLDGLLRLPESWDSYGACRIDPRAVAAAVKLLDKTVRANTPEPAVVPSPRGGIQLEWHTRTIDLEVEVPPTGPFRVVYENFDTGNEWEDELGFDLDPLAKAIAELSDRA